MKTGDRVKIVETTTRRLNKKLTNVTGTILKGPDDWKEDVWSSRRMIRVKMDDGLGSYRFYDEECQRIKKMISYWK